MLYPRLKKIKIQGFRAFGSEFQEAEFDAPISVFWGGNSKGKTSFAEAVEFLLTGNTVKRNLLSSRKDEFADSLRHAHLEENIEAYIEIDLEDNNGVVKTIRRTLDSDYTKREECKTTLYIDGSLVQEDELIKLGIILFQAPLKAPVLAQHTLNYLFTVKPSERSSYFKALLEVNDLGELRESIVALEEDVPQPNNNHLTKFNKIIGIELFASHFDGADLKNYSNFCHTFNALVEAILSEHEIVIDNDNSKNIISLIALLSEKQEKTFPVNLLKRKQFSEQETISNNIWSNIETYLAEKNNISLEIEKLTTLFQSVLAIEELSALEGNTDCPVCETKDALSSERIKLIRESVQNTASYQLAKTNVLNSFRSLSDFLGNVQNSAKLSLPEFIRIPSHKRKQVCFTVERINELLEEPEKPSVEVWLESFKNLCQNYRKLRLHSTMLSNILDGVLQDASKIQDKESIKEAFDILYELINKFKESSLQYEISSDEIEKSLRTVIDSKSNTEGWQDIIDLTYNLQPVHEELLQEKAVNDIKSELTVAIRDIDKGIEKVLDDKFLLLSEGVSEWWNKLRGGESTFFSTVKRRGRSTIDFKAGLIKDGEKVPKIRDVIAVFSDSQLHCLGLSIFLARAEKYGSSFILLDDPVLSSDEDYRIHFRSIVIGRLHDLGIQVIILTQHKQTWKDIASVNDHLGVDQFQISIPDSSQASVINKTSDEFSAMLASAQAYTNSSDPQIRKDGGQKLRDAAERFCKMLLVKKSREQGQLAASISDYDNSRLSGDNDLISMVIPYLDIDNSHPGKLRTMRSDLNPSNHDDDDVPSQTALKEALGNLRKFKKDYLS